MYPESNVVGLPTATAAPSPSAVPAQQSWIVSAPVIIVNTGLSLLGAALGLWNFFSGRKARKEAEKNEK